MSDIEVRMTVRQWATIDAVLDDASTDAAEEGEDFERFIAIRELAAGQVPWVPPTDAWPPTNAWPPNEQVIPIRLGQREWSVIASTLRKHATRLHTIGATEDLNLLLDAQRALGHLPIAGDHPSEAI